MNLPTARELIKAALIDAIQWQESFAETNHRGSPERRGAMQQARAYRAILKRRYGTDRTPMEAAFDGASTISLDELRKGHATNV